MGLKEKATRSGYSAKTIEHAFEKYDSKMESQADALNPVENDQQQDFIAWPTTVPQLQIAEPNSNRFSKKGVKIKPVWKRPANIRSTIPGFRYRHLSNPEFSNRSRSQSGGSSSPCGHCKCCGKFGAKEAMVVEKNRVRTASGTELRLKGELKCSNNGVYSLTCKLCLQANHKPVGIYVGKTTRTFNTRMQEHRSNFKARDRAVVFHESTDKYALLRHIFERHSRAVGRSFEECFELTFVESPEDSSQLGRREDFWCKKLEANMNIQAMFTPAF